MVTMLGLFAAVLGLVLLNVPIFVEEKVLSAATRAQESADLPPEEPA